VRVLDLYCGGGGVAVGFAVAGFEVVGVDIVDRRDSYPFEFHRADALEYPLDGFDLITASPPCQAYSFSTSRFRANGREYADLVSATRERLRASGIPWVIENVVGAPLINPITLCGQMFGLGVVRHRLFESSFKITPPPHPRHTRRCARMGTMPEPGDLVTVVGGARDLAYGSAAMGVWWMSGTELSQSIPPVYSLYIGRAFLGWSARQDPPPESMTEDAVDQPDGHHGFRPEILTRLPGPDDGRLARERELAAECSRRYRARRRGENVPLRKPGPKASPVTALRRRHAYLGAELARERTLRIALEMMNDEGNSDGSVEEA
jgi:DNA (cytosine-5)-methyltransferase 1